MAWVSWGPGGLGVVPLVLGAAAGGAAAYKYGVADPHSRTKSKRARRAAGWEAAAADRVAVAAWIESTHAARRADTLRRVVYRLDSAMAALRSAFDWATEAVLRLRAFSKAAGVGGDLVLAAVSAFDQAWVPASRLLGVTAEPQTPEQAAELLGQAEAALVQLGPAAEKIEDLEFELRRLIAERAGR
jgi:hypothetical protein